RLGVAAGLERRFVLIWLLGVAGHDVETPWLRTLVVFVVRRLAAVLGRERRSVDEELLAEARDHSEARRLADHEVLTPVVEGVAGRNADRALAVRIAGERQTADDAVAVERAVAQPVLLDVVAQLQRKVLARQQVAAEVLRAHEAAERAAARRRFRFGTVA